MQGELDRIAKNLLMRGWFSSQGVYAVVDGQFGSTGKGVAASILAHTVVRSFYANHFVATTNAGPNSGHTAVYGAKKFVSQQIPISAAQARWAGNTPWAYLNAGSIISVSKLMEEITDFKMDPGLVHVHPNAAVITDEHILAEASGGPAMIAGTGKGVGAALANKVMREANLAKHFLPSTMARELDLNGECVIMEVAQGFSLGINQRFYPHCTSRECTVGQALSDANLHPSVLKKTMMVVRTFPIRVGNTSAGESGPFYPDQKETSWEEIGQTPELTTVTKRVRRVFTWSRQQFIDALRVNRPEVVFINFMNYLHPDAVDNFVDGVKADYKLVMGHGLPTLLTGWGPETEQVRLWN